MTALAPGLSWVDLNFLGRPHAIATVVVKGDGALALIDPGPSSCLPTLERGLETIGRRFADVTELLLTHIHLDHAGATGTILRSCPGARVLVHERGAPHIVDPSKLVASAERLYRDEMQRLWGEIAPVPEKNLEILTDGDRIEAGGRSFEVAYTPGHASHHVSYFDRMTGVAFVGDTGGVCVDGGYILPPTPPPDIDIEAWRGSVARLQAWSPGRLFMTHFGPVDNPDAHLGTLLANLDAMAAQVRARMEEPGSQEEKARRFADDLTEEMRGQMSEAQVAAYLAAAPPDLLWLGLERYWKKRGQPARTTS